MAGFGSDVEKWVIETKKKLEQIPRLSAMVVAADVRVPKDAGGNMPVKYGNLRNSLVASLSGLPSADVVITEDRLVLSDPMDQIASVVDSSKIGDIISMGFTVNYSTEQELKNAFVRLTAQKWPVIVEEVAKKLNP